MQRESCLSRWGRRLEWFCRRGCAASPVLGVQLECRSGGRTILGRAGEPTRGQVVQTVMRQWSLRVMIINDCRISRFRRTGLVLKEKRNRIARPSSLDEGNGEEWPANFWGLTSGPAGHGQGCSARRGEGLGRPRGGTPPRAPPD